MSIKNILFYFDDRAIMESGRCDSAEPAEGRLSEEGVYGDANGFTYTGVILREIPQLPSLNIEAEFQVLAKRLRETADNWMREFHADRLPENLKDTLDRAQNSTL